MNNNPLHGKTLKDIVEQLVDFYGFDTLAELINIKCFKENPSVKSSLTFLRKTDWARKKAEDLYAVAKRIKEILKDEHIKERADQFYAAKLLTILQALQTNHLQSSALAKTLRREISPLNISEIGLRTQVLKMVLVKFPFLYPAFRFVYDLFFMKNQKWKNH